MEESEPIMHREIVTELAHATVLNCSCEGLAVMFNGGEWKRSEIDAKFREHLSEQEPNVTPDDQCFLDLTHIGGNRFPTGEPHHWIWTKSPYSVFVGVCSICHTVNFEDLRATVEQVWKDGFMYYMNTFDDPPLYQRDPQLINPYRGERHR